MLSLKRVLPNSYYALSLIVMVTIENIVPHAMNDLELKLLRLVSKSPIQETSSYRRIIPLNM